MCVPADIAALTFPEQLVLWSLRNWVSGQGRHKLIERELCHACGCSAGRIALSSLASAMTALTCGAKRKLCWLPLPCREIAADEALILGLIAAGQARDWRHLDTQSRALVRPEAVHPLRESIARLGAALEVGSRILPPRYALPTTGDIIH